MRNRWFPHFVAVHVVPLACLLTAFHVSPVQAGTRVLPVVRGAGAGAEKAAVHVNHYLRSLLEEDSRFDVVHLDEVFEGKGRASATRAIETAKADVARGQRAWEELDLDRAVQLLSGAVSRMGRNVSYLQDYPAFADALALLAAAHLLRGEEGSAKQRLQEALLIAPDLEPDPAVFNADMRKIFANVERQMRRNPRGTLVMASNPGYGEIYVDGRFMGVTPDSLDELGQGVHYVRVHKDGYSPWGKAVGIFGDSEDSANAVMSRVPNASEYLELVTRAARRVAGQSKRGSRVPDEVDQMGTLTNVDHVMFGVVRLDGDKVAVELSVYDLLKSRRVRRSEQVFSYQSATSVYRAEVKDLLRQAAPESRRAMSDGDDGEQLGAVSYAFEDDTVPAYLLGPGGECEGFLCTNQKRAAFGVGIVGIAAAAGAGAMWALSSAQAKAFDDPDLTQFQASAHQANAKQFALLGDVLIGVGSAAIVTAVTLWFLDRDFGPPPDEFEDESGEDDDTITEIGATFDIIPTPLPGGAALGAHVRF